MAFGAQAARKLGASATTAATSPVAATAGAPIRGSVSFGPAGGLPFTLGTTTPPTLHYVITCNNGESFKGSLTGSGAIRYPDVPTGTRCTVRPTPSAGLPDVAPQSFPPVPGGGVSSVSYVESSPQIVVSPPDGPSGRPTTVYGIGFPPDRRVTVSWPANLGAPVSALTDPGGRLVLTIMVLPHSALGDLEIVASGNGFPTVSTTYLVVEPSVEPGGTPAQLEFRS